MSIPVRQLAQTLQLEFRGAGDLPVRNVASLGSAIDGDLCFITKKKYLVELSFSQCSVVILPVELFDSEITQAVLISDNPQASFAKVIEALGLAQNHRVGAGIHPSAQIADSAQLGDNVSVGALSVIEAHVMIGNNTIIGAGVVIEQSVVIGIDCRIHSRVTLAKAVKLGDRCELHSGAVIGADGFGLAQDQQQWRKLPQLGSVQIEDDVEIGANTTIDRGALDDTVIEQGCKLDNQIQVAHNVRIGSHTAIAACVGIAGSATIGRHCKISGAAVILGHLQVADHVTITAMSLVTKDIKQAGVYSSGTPLLENSRWHRNNARYKNLDQLAKTVARLDDKQG